MELGGKSGAIVHADADLDQAAAGVAHGIFHHAGQICSAGSRLIVHRSIHDDLVERVVKAARARTVGPGIDGCVMGPLTSARQLDRVEALYRVGVEEGAPLVLGGARLPDRTGHFMAPTVFVGVRPDMRIAQEEFFGPVLVVMPFDALEEAIAIANGTEYGLAAGVYTCDLRLAPWTAGRLIAGQVYVNEWWAGGSRPHSAE